MKRPIGVTIIAVLAIIGAVLMLLASLPFLGIEVSGLVGGLGAQDGMLAVGSALGMGIGLVMLVSAVVQLVFGIGALQLKSWAWTLGIVLYGLSVVTYVVSLFTVGVTVSVVTGIVVAGLILAYLFSHDVREAFGHLPSGTSMTGTPTPTH